MGEWLIAVAVIAGPETGGTVDKETPLSHRTCSASRNREVNRRCCRSSFSCSRRGNRSHWIVRACCQSQRRAAGRGGKAVCVCGHLTLFFTATIQRLRLCTCRCPKAARNLLDRVRQCKLFVFASGRMIKKWRRHSAGYLKQKS